MDNIGCLRARNNLARSSRRPRSRPLGRREFLAAVGGLAGAVSLEASGVVRLAESAPGRGGTLTYGLGPFDLDNTMDPQVTNSDSTIRVTLNICEPLVWEPTPGKFMPALAESWETSTDVKTYTFHLRKGVKFHDGTPFTAEAVKFTMDRVIAPETKAGQSHDQLGPYDHTEIVDNHTARIVMKEGFAPLLTNLNGYLGIVSPAAVKKMGLADFARHPVGTGPFMFKEWIPKDHVTLVRNPGYNWASSMFKHQGSAYLDQVIFKIIPEGSVRTGTLKSGETQYVDDIDPFSYEAFRGDKRFVVIERGQPGSGFVLLLNMTSKGPIAELAVRRAIAYGVDREGLNKSVFHGLNRVAWSPLMRPTFGYDPSTEKIYSFDPNKAKQMLDEAGWKAVSDGIREKAGRKLSIDFPIIGRPRDKAMAESVQASLHDVGIDLKVTPLERAAFRDVVRQNRYDVNFMWFSYGDPDVLRTIFHSANVNAFNRARYQVPELDRMLEEAAAATNTARRAALYSRVQHRVLRDAVCVPLVDTLTYNAKRAEVQGDAIDALASYVWLYDVQIKR
jgi:peptide/nickel transport system substrate-binding protein